MPRTRARAWGLGLAGSAAVRALAARSPGSTRVSLHDCMIAAARSGGGTASATGGLGSGCECASFATLLACLHGSVASFIENALPRLSRSDVRQLHCAGMHLHRFGLTTVRRAPSSAPLAPVLPAAVSLWLDPTWSHGGIYTAWITKSRRIRCTNCLTGHDPAAMQLHAQVSSVFCTNLEIWRRSCEPARHGSTVKIICNMNGQDSVATVDVAQLVFS